MAFSFDPSRPPSDLASPPPSKMRSRNQSISSDRPSTSTVSHSFMSPPLSVSPEACFIAASAASQIVTNDHDSHADTWYDQNGVEPSGETALVSPAALHLVNNFLDQLLFNFLSISRSTTLSALRPAVSEVLKPKLAKDAINQADEELREYLGGGDDEDALLRPGSSADAARDWDLELIWKRTRLRCMVYSSLGDMEEEDEDFYMEQGHLVSGLGEDAQPELASPAVAIFLTSILEFMGEQALIVAGQAAYLRIRARHEKELRDGARGPADLADRIVVEELDMERVALDRTLGRLWRAWKKKIRSPGLDHSLSRSFSRDSMRALASHMRQPSFTTESAVPPTVMEPAEKNDNLAEEPTIEEEETVDEHLLAASIPLPTNERDVEEIETPWLATYSDDDEVTPALRPIVESNSRPKSLMILPRAGAIADLPTPALSQPHTPIVLPARRRSNSLPTPAASPYAATASKRPRVRPIVTTFGPLAGFEAERGAAGEEDEPEHRFEATAEATPPVSPTAQSSSGRETRHSRHSSRVSAIISGAVAMGNAAAAGVTSIANGSALQTEPESSDGSDDEEPQILTTSRISISGRSASPSVSEYSRHAVASPMLPARSPSVHSLRLIDVAGPRSPSTRSWTSSTDALDAPRSGSYSSNALHLSTSTNSHHHTNNNNSNNNTATTPIVQELRATREVQPVAAPRRNSVGYPPAKSPRVNTSPSISEAEEAAGVEQLSPPPPPPPPRASATSVPASAAYRAKRNSRTFGGRAQGSPPVSPAKGTKVTILRSSTTSTPLPERERERERERPQAQRPAAPERQARAPEFPERSPRKDSYSTPQSPLPSPQAGTIGIPTVERSRARTVSESTYASAHDPAGSAPRQIHTSGSSSTSSTNKPKPVRTSEESAHVSSKAEMARNFEQLIHSDQTIQYTLTPEGMRDMESQSSRSLSISSPVVTVKTRKSEDARFTGERSRSSSVNRPSDAKASPPAPNPASLYSRSGSDAPSGSNTKPSSGPVPRLPPAIPAAVPSKPRASGPQAREAKMQRESLSDFAEFIRSTGPPGEAPPPASGGNAFTRAMGPGAPKNTPPPSAPKESLESSRASMSTASRARLQARDAAVAARDDNSDLIDFIRRGPPSAAGNHRIPRTVAPFRSTMDSDQMSAAVGGRAVDAQIRDSDMRGSETSTVTDYSSVTSQTALLRNKNFPKGGGGGGGSSSSGYRGDADMPIPPRKSRRVRDPYALDLSDEEEDIEEEEAPPEPVPVRASAPAPAPSSRPPAQEESLADFLMNYPPPPEPEVQPFTINEGRAQNNSNSQKRPKKKASAPSLMSRFTRRDSSAASTASLKSPKQQPQQRPDARSLSSRAGGGRNHIPIQVTMPPGDKYSGPATASPAMVGGGGASARPRMMKPEPREAMPPPARTGTSDLADFLRNSGPPQGMTSPAPLPPSRGFREEKTGFSKVFSSRRKPSVGGLRN